MPSLDQINRHLLHPFENKKQLSDAVEELWRNFTSERSKLDHYLDDERLVSAYTAFYLTTNLAKLQSVLSYANIDPDIFEDFILWDIGCGPGTFSVAFDELVFGHDRQIFGIETSELMQKQATMLLKGLGIKRAKVYDKIEQRPSGKNLMLFGHSINEMKSVKAHKYVDKVDPEVIIAIEPGTPTSFAELLEFRKTAIEKGYHCIYPCPTNSVCPMQDSEDWCHQYIKVNLDPDLASIAQMLKLDRHLQAICCFIFVKDKNFTNHAMMRLVRFYRQTKHSFDWQVCTNREAHNELDDVEVSKKYNSKKEIKEIADIFPGQSVDYTVVKELPDKKRVKLNL